MSTTILFEFEAKNLLKGGRGGARMCQSRGAAEFSHRHKNEKFNCPELTGIAPGCEYDRCHRFPTLSIHSTDLFLSPPYVIGSIRTGSLVPSIVSSIEQGQNSLKSRLKWRREPQQGLPSLLLRTTSWCELFSEGSGLYCVWKRNVE